VAACDLQYRSIFSRSWTPLLSATTRTAALFTGGAGQAYLFRVRALDRVGNTGAWAQSLPLGVKRVTKYYPFGGKKVAMRKDGEVYYLHSDHPSTLLRAGLGTAALTTDAAGNAVYAVRHHPFGGQRWHSGSALTDFTFTGQRLDGFGLPDYKARKNRPEGFSIPTFGDGDSAPLQNFG